MRVIGGEARGRPLKAPVPQGVRPTSDRVREAIFDVLASLDALAGATVLDAFAGTGALGIEALSRGAATVTFVESDRAAVTAISANLERLGYAGRPGVRVVRSEVLGFLASSRARFDLALVDPPYRFEQWSPLLARLRAGIAVLESDAPLELGPGYDIYRSYRHGGTLVTVVTGTVASDPEDVPGPGQGEEGST